MRAAFAYLGRGSWLARRDPRSLLLAAFLFVIGAPQLRDARQLLVVAVLALGYYLLAGIPWKSVRRQWMYLVVVITAVAFVNALITGGQSGGFVGTETHVLLTIPPFGAELTAEGISLVVTQVLRFIAIAAVGFPVAYAIAPGDLGPALRQLGLGAHAKGLADFSWDGKLADGTTAAPGVYSLSAQLVVNGRTQSAASVLANARVESVTIGADQSGLTLSLAGLGDIAFSDVRQIR